MREERAMMGRSERSGGAVTPHVLICEVANYTKAVIAAAGVRRFAGGPPVARFRPAPDCPRK